MEISRLATEVIPANPGLQRYKKNSNFVPRLSNLACGILTLYFCNPKNVLSECPSCLIGHLCKETIPTYSGLKDNTPPKVVALLEGMTLLECV